MIPVLLVLVVALSFVVSSALAAFPGGSEPAGSVVAGKRTSTKKSSSASTSKSATSKGAKRSGSASSASTSGSAGGASASTLEPGLHVAPASIDTTCTKDVTTALSDWIASVPDGSTLSFAPAGCYRVEGSLKIWDRNDLTFEGNGATFKALAKGALNPRFGYSERRHFWFRSSDSMTLRNINVVSTNTVSDRKPGFGSYQSKYEFEHAFAFQGCEDLLLENLTADAVWGDGIYLGGSMKHPTKNVVIRNVSIDRNGRQGVALTGAENVLIDNVDLLHSRRAGFDFEPNPNGYVRNVEVRNSYTNTILLAFPSAGYGEVNNIYIHHNTIDGNSAPWVAVAATDGYRRKNWKVWDNTVLHRLGGTKATMSFSKVDGVDIRRNVSHVSIKRSRLAVTFFDAGGSLVVKDNDFDGACSPFWADAATGPVSVSGNTISTC